MNKARLAYLEDFSTIVSMPLPQLNTVNFVGMRNKHEYVAASLFRARAVAGEARGDDWELRPSRS